MAYNTGTILPRSPEDCGSFTDKTTVLFFPLHVCRIMVVLMTL